MEARLPSPGPEAAPLSPAERQWRAVPLLGWPLVLGAAPLLLTTGVPLCGFRHLTRQPCPLCGGTHACAALVQGDWAAAWAASPGALVLLLWLVLLAGQAVVEGAQGRRRVARWPWWHPAVLAAVGGGLAVSWVLRLAGLV